MFTYSIERAHDLRQRRAALGLSQATVAANLFCCDSIISAMECGRFCAKNNALFNEYAQFIERCEKGIIHVQKSSLKISPVQGRYFRCHNPATPEQAREIAIMRRAKRISQEELADAVNLAQYKISYYETGKLHMPLSIYEKAREFLNAQKKAGK